MIVLKMLETEMKRLILIAGLCSFVGMAFLTANADTVYVSPDGDDANAGTSDAPKKTIQMVLNNWQSGRVLVLKTGTYHLQEQKLESDTGALHLNGTGEIRGETGNPADVVIDGDATTECIRIAGKMFVHGMTFQNGKKASSNAYAANLSVQASTVVVSNCIVRSAAENGQGDPAAKLLDGAKIVDCRFLAITGTCSGAALDLAGTNEVVRCVFQDCDVPFRTDANPPCAVRLRRATRLSDCVFTNNTGISLHATCTNDTPVAISTVANCLFAGNTGARAACRAEDHVVVAGCTFASNVSTTSAGALHAFGATVTNCTFVGNFAEHFGGALLSRTTPTCPTRVVDCFFAENSAHNGGAVSVGYTDGATVSSGCSSGYMLMNRCLISNNVARATSPTGSYLGGGGIFFAAKAVGGTSGGEIHNSQIVDNRSGWEGGGVCVRNWNPTAGFTGSWPILMRNCLVARNTAAVEGGGLYFIHNGADSPYVVDSCTVVGNTAKNHASGHGLYHKLDGFSCINSVFAKNTVLSNNAGQYDHCCFDPNQNTAFNMSTAPNSLTADAQLVDPDAGDYRLASVRSPCCNAGLRETWMEDAVDLDGKARIFSSAPDMGCYELSWPVGTMLLFR